MITLIIKQKTGQNLQHKLIKRLYKLFNAYKLKGNDISRINLARHNKVDINKKVRNTLQLIAFYDKIADKLMQDTFVKVL